MHVVIALVEQVQVECEREEDEQEIEELETVSETSQRRDGKLEHDLEHLQEHDDNRQILENLLEQCERRAQRGRLELAQRLVGHACLVEHALDVVSDHLATDCQTVHHDQHDNEHIESHRIEHELELAPARAHEV